MVEAIVVSAATVATVVIGRRVAPMATARLAPTVTVVPLVLMAIAPVLPAPTVVPGAMAIVPLVASEMAPTATVARGRTSLPRRSCRSVRSRSG